ncbi:peptidase C12, ubiquitin carboxyl-terminal hydrolase [Cytidiella melzeri]|nr:peptidase C12, ubiquitin carboxyl-terminal hydrolase [Cytidiella melzeri]
MSTKLSWVPLEINPDVMNKWAEKGGVATNEYEFRDIYALDPEMLAFVPQPVKAVILLFPYNAGYLERRADDNARIAKSGQHPIHPNVIWIKQTIHNACGTMALLHTFANARPFLFSSVSNMW